MKKVEIGSAVTVVDEVGVTHNALVTNTWGPGEYEDDAPGPTINVAILAADETKTDSYGRQVERLPSTQHQKATSAPGRYWY